MSDSKNSEDNDMKQSIPSSESTTSKIESNKEKKIPPRILEKIGDLLTDICEEGKKISTNNISIKPFLSKKIPSISIKSYLSRLYKYSKMNDSTMVLMLIYIDKICEISKFKLTYYNIHKLLLASMVIAIKYNEDDFYSSKYYASIGGVSNKEMNYLEYEFLRLLNFSLFIDEKLYDKYNNYIISADNDSDNEN